MKKPNNKEQTPQELSIRSDGLLNNWAFMDSRMALYQIVTFFDDQKIDIDLACAAMIEILCMSVLTEETMIKGKDKKNILINHIRALLDEQEEFLKGGGK